MYVNEVLHVLDGSRRPLLEIDKDLEQKKIEAYMVRAATANKINLKMQRTGNMHMGH
jgi:hypothetical protein